MSIYVYLAIIKDIEDNNIKVIGLKLMNTTKQIFNLIKSDVFDTNLEKLQAVLHYPKVESVGKCIEYIFLHT